MKKSLYVLLCAAALVSCGQPKQQQKAVADVVTSGNPIFEGWYADPEGIIYGDTYWVSRPGAMRMRSRLILTVFHPRIW